MNWPARSAFAGLSGWPCSETGISVSLRKSTKVFIVLAVVVGLPFYWLLFDNRPGGIQPHKLDLVQLRAEANRLAGPKPTSIDYEIVAMRRLPGGYVAAGSGLKRRLLGTLAFRLNAPGGAILLSSGLTPADCHAAQCESYFPDRQRGVEKAMAEARMILFTSEDADHMGGFVASPQWQAIAGKALLMPEQMPGGPVASTLAWPKDLSGLRPALPAVPVQAVAPGVVLIRTAGHTPGSQMIFVQLENGREFLFVGDISPLARNVLQLRAGSRLMTDWLHPEDRREQFAWLKAIRALVKAEPQVFVVPAHDPDYLLSPRTGRPLKLHFDDTTGIPAGLMLEGDDN